MSGTLAETRSPARHGAFDEIRHPKPAWIPARGGGWRRRLAGATITDNVRNVAASCTMILSSFVLGVASLLLYGAPWGCTPASCPAKCAFVAGLGIQSAILLILSLTLFLSSAQPFDAALRGQPPLAHLPAVLGALTVVTYHWVLYGTYAKIVGRACTSAQLERAYSVLLVLGHVLLGTPSLVTALIWRQGHGRRRTGFVESETLCQEVDDETAAPSHERKSLLAYAVVAVDDDDVEAAC